jgi:hypothetical protein
MPADLADRDIPAFLFDVALRVTAGSVGLL